MTEPTLHQVEEAINENLVFVKPEVDWESSYRQLAHNYAKLLLLLRNTTV